MLSLISSRVHLNRSLDTQLPLCYLLFDRWIAIVFSFVCAIQEIYHYHWVVCKREKAMLPRVGRGGLPTPLADPEMRTNGI